MFEKILYITLAVCLSACCTNRHTNKSSDLDKVANTANATTSSIVNGKDINAQGFWGKTFADLCRQSKEENICLSPLSAQFAMAMLANGAEGETKEEICKALGSYTDTNAHYNKLLESTLENKDYEIDIANSIWINDKLKVNKSFITSNKKYYDATIEVTEFCKNTLQRINDWCKENTKGKIPSILNDIDPNDRMFLINTLYFNAAWNKPFPKENTRKDNFTTEKGKVVEVEMMKLRENLLYSNNDRFEIALKRYNGDYSMLLALPKENVECSEVAEGLMQNLDDCLSEMNTCNVDLSLPKFTTEFGSSLKEVLEQQGITKTFSADAELKGISDTPLYVDDIIQKTYINVDEEGTEAVAVTAITVRLTSIRPEKIVAMKFNRPFVYAIINNENNEVLFVGKVGNPIEK